MRIFSVRRIFALGFIALIVYGLYATSQWRVFSQCRVTGDDVPRYCVD